MNNLTSRYQNPSDPDKFVFITGVQGFKKFKVYSDGKQIGIVDSADFTQNQDVTLTCDKLGDIKLYVVKSKEINVLINGENYIREKEKANGNDLKSITRAFWLLILLSVLGTLLVLIDADFNFEDSILQNQLIYDVLFTSSYLVAAIFLAREQAWAYFIGTATYTISTILTILVLSSILNVFTIAIIVLRLAFLAYLLSHITNIIRLIREDNSHTQNEDLLDTP